MPFPSSSLYFHRLGLRVLRVKITISGGTLTGAIEIADSRILDISSVCGGRFLDPPAQSVVEAARVVPTCEVWSYIKSVKSGVERRYVLYYSPSASQRGLIYLPGRGQRWHWLNVNAILRDGQDEKWNYASAPWEELIKPVITRAEAASTRRP